MIRRPFLIIFILKGWSSLSEFFESIIQDHLEVLLEKHFLHNCVTKFGLHIVSCLIVFIEQVP